MYWLNEFSGPFLWKGVMEGPYGNATNAAMAGELKNLQHILILMLCLLLNEMHSLQRKFFVFFSGKVLRIH